MKRIIPVLLILLLFTLSCAAGPEIQAKKNQYLSTIPTCQAGVDCKQKWEAAQVWVASVCGMKIQTVSDTIIQTYGPTGNVADSMLLAAQVIKEPIGNGVYRIGIKTYCGNMWGCHPDAWDAALNFNAYVGNVH